MMSPEIMDKFAKVLGLLGSDQDGERASAAKIGTALLRQFKLTWADVAEAFAAAQVPRPQASQQRMQGGNALALDLLAHYQDDLSDWEIKFLRSIRTRSSLTQKQSECLTRIVERVSSANSSWRG